MLPRFRALAIVLLATSLLAATSHPAPAPNRWALVIGISDYLHYEDEPGGDLPGAANDARASR